MASFSTAFGLCSITDSKSLLGVSGDNENCAVVTLGKSMVIRCRLSDQKQVNSWSTTLTKLTSKVLWNPVNKSYIGVFDNVYLKEWTKQDTTIEKSKKHKFKNEIEDIILSQKDNISKETELVVLFKNGSIRDLDYALRNSKEIMPDVIQPQETIESADIVVENGLRHLIIITKYENKYRQLYSLKLQDKNFLVSSSIEKIKLRRQGTSLLGYVILTGDKGNLLLTLWSDGFLYLLPLPLASEKSGVGKYLGAIKSVSKNSEVAMQAISQDHIAIYGADPSEEGAFLGIYNVKFGVIQAQTSFKMFNKPPRMWSIDNNLVIVMGQRLVCVPFNLQTETLSALVGSRALHTDLQSPSEICTIVPTAVWDESFESEKKAKAECPGNIKEQLSALSSEGWSEYGICQALMTHLIEAKDINTLFWCLNNFTHIPEDHLIRMILLALKDSEEAFNELVEGNLPETDIKIQFLNKILTTPIDNLNLLKKLKLLLTFEDCLKLIYYLHGLYSINDVHKGVPAEDCSVLLEWTMTLLDSFYQHFILSRDSKVLELIVLLKERIDENILFIDDLKKILPSLIRLKNGRGVENKPAHSKSYSVEKFTLYQ